MATRFVRVDLSESARDYRPIAVEPGVPMLDRSGANARILFRWLGGMVAEPVWEDDVVGFYVRDDKGGRLEDVICQPASAQDLQGMLRDDLGKLRQRLEESKGETPTERTLRKILMRTFQEMVDNPARTDLDSYFFRYRDVLGNWRLIWCWGYERLDHEPAPSVVCTDPECNLLFVRRPGKSPRCPSCAGLLQTRPKRKGNWKIAALALLLLLLLVGGIGWWMWKPAALVATPTQFSGPVGTRIDCQVFEKSLFKKKEVTHDAIGITCNPRVATFNQATGSFRLTGVGTTKIEFQYDGRKTEIVVSATAPVNPDKLVIEPHSVDLAVGTTAHLKVFGEYKDGTRVDLTEATEWCPQNDGKVFAQGSLVEGLAPGSSTIGARYRGASDAKYIESAATVNVLKADFQSIEVGVDPTTVGIGLSGKVHIDGITSDGKHYSLLDSSQLKTEVSPGYVATLHGDTLQGQRVGNGKLAVTFGAGLQGSSDFSVALPRTFGAVVHPENLDLAVGEIADIAYVSPDRSPVHLSCSKVGIVDITPDNRVIGRAVGDTQVTVNQSGKTLGTVNVTVAKADFQGIFFDPGSLAVEVDDTMKPKVFAMVAGSDPPRNAEIAPDRIVTEKKPAAEFAGFDPKAFELSGVKPTETSSPQELAVAMGSLKATAPVEVVLAPCRLELTPAGPIDLPLGQMMRLQGFANYSGGRRVEIRSERLKWFSQEKSVPGLELYDKNDAAGAVGAVKAGAGPLNVYANYHGQESNRVAFKSVDADPNVKLDIDVDRTLRIAGEGGRVVLTASSPSGDVELVPSLTSFKSSNDKVLKFTSKENLGLFGTGIPGSAMVTGSHLAAKEPAKKEFHVGDPAKMSVKFDPASVRVPVNQKTELRLILQAEMDDGGKKVTEMAVLEGPEVGYYVAQPQSVRFNPPILTGISPASPFDISGSVHMLRPATAKVEVVAADTKNLRITPSAASPLAAGQQVSLMVEEQVGDTDAWQEVRPDAVEWTVPANLIWTPPTESLRPTVTLLPDLKGNVKVDASAGGKSASAEFTLKAAGPDAKDPAARLVLDREPDGKFLPVGQSQRYAVIVDKGGNREPAADVHWPESFENEYVKWDAPVLTAKKEGYTQFLRAEAGGRNVLWHTTTYLPGEYVPDTQNGPPPQDHPDWVKIFRQQGSQEVQDARFPVGATYTDFKVEVHYPDGFTRFVTKKAVLRTPEPAASALLTADHGKLIGLRPGSTEITAEYEGLASTKPLKVDVTADVDIDKIAIHEGNFSMLPGETHELHVDGYKGGLSVGDITGLGNLNWKSSNPDKVRMSGSSVNAAALGQSDITVERKGLASLPAQVTVSNTTEDLRVDPPAIQMFTGESQQFGNDIHVTRDGLDVSRQATAVPENPGVVQFDPATHALHALGAGSTVLNITMGNGLTRVPVTVTPHVAETGSKLVVEQASVISAVGQADTLNAYLETPTGKINTMAVFKSTDPSIATVDASGRLCAPKPGKTDVKASVPGVPTCIVPVEVTSEEITELRADPASLEMAVGDHRHLRIFGAAAKSGLKEMFPQADLKVAPRTPNFVDVIGGEDVQAKAIGDDTIDASWRDKLKIAVPVKVVANTITDLQIDPPNRTISVGQAVPYVVTGLRGGNRVVLTPQDGLQLNDTNPSVANIPPAKDANGNDTPGMTAVAIGTGDTDVIATLGGQSAKTRLSVVAGAPGVLAVGDGVNVINGPGVIYGGGQTVVGGVAPPVGSLTFEPPFYQQGVQAIPQTAKLLRANASGGFDDVSNDPNVKITEPKPEVAKVEKVDGGWKLTPVAPGVTKMSGTLDNQIADMAIEFLGDKTTVAGGEPAGQLVVVPSQLDLWSGETKPIVATIDPGGGMASSTVPVTVKAPNGQGIVAVDGSNVTGRSVGDVAVTVSTAGGKTATVNVHVTAADSLAFNPPELQMQPNDSRPAAVMAKSASGAEVAVQAQIDSLDKNVLDADPAQPGQFVARAPGQTQLHAVYRGKEVTATVTVAGKRFESVKPTHNRIDKEHFDMTVEVLAAAGEGELEYRVYAEGDANPKENWVPNQPEGDSRKVTLRSDPLSYNSGDEYHLVIEARDKATKSVQKYPLTLVRSITVDQQKDSPQPNGSK